MADLWLPGEDDQTYRQRLHNTVFCQCYSPCGKYLAAGTNFGHIAIFRPDAVEPHHHVFHTPESVKQVQAVFVEMLAKTIENYKSVIKVLSHSGPVYCLDSTERLLISGGSGDIQAWLWTDITSKNPKVTWAFSIPTVDHFARPETNSLAVSIQDDTKTLFAGCGDNRVHIWDVESGKYIRSLDEHTDYVHCVTVWNNGTECASAAEDGTVRIWDTRISGGSTGVIEPYKHEMCARPQFGKWLSCVVIDKSADWLVCGGGPHLCMWHLRTLNPTSVFHTPTTHNTVCFQDDSLISGGSDPCVYHWLVNGEKKAQVPCSSTNVFNISFNEKSEDTKVLCISGNTNKIDVCTNFGYKAFSLSIY